jgi:Zn-dependent peptidase ImmA (M78 family)
MPSYRDAILTGVARATDLHDKLGVRDALAGGDAAIDVIGAVQKVGLFMMFRPLDGLLGAYVPTRALPGMLVTTKRDLHVQRFTVAHELGHHLLEHKALSLDANVGFVGRGEASKYDLQEVEADAFAAEFLLPKWLIVAHLRRQRWDLHQLQQPDFVYQLSLRLGASYSATCWALLSQDFLTRRSVEGLLSVEPKTAKQRAVPEVQPADWHRDVWIVSEIDRGSKILGSPNDLIVVELDEHVSGGYSWDAEGVAKAGMKLEHDKRISQAGVSIGGQVQRRMVVQGEGEKHLRLEERRAWAPSQPSRNTFDIDLTLVGREPEGIPRSGRVLAA